MHDILGWVALAAAIVAGLTAAWWALWVRPRPKRFCPGRRPGPWWLPWRLAWMPRCGYDLAAVGEQQGVERRVQVEQHLEPAPLLQLSRDDELRPAFRAAIRSSVARRR